MSTHQCPAPFCDARVDDRLFACKAHWFALPLAVRRAIAEACPPGQGAAAWSPDYRAAIAAAQAFYAGEPAEGAPQAPPA